MKSKNVNVAKNVKHDNSHSNSNKTKHKEQQPLFLINKTLEKYGFYILLSLIAVIAFIVFKDFIFFKKLYLFKDIGSDSINTSFPQYIHISDYLRSNGIPKWSFNQGMGQNIFPFCFTDPFVFFLYVINGNSIAYGLIYVEIMKIILAGIFFYLFLRKLTLSTYSAIIGGILYSFSAFIILGGCWWMFSIEAVYLALLLYSFELLYQDNKWFLFPVCIALISILNPFDLSIFSIFLFIYFLFRFFEEAKYQPKRFFIVLLKMAGLGLLGMAITSFFFIGDILQMLDSPRVSGDSSYFSKLMSRPVFDMESNEHYATAIMRLFSSDMLGVGIKFKGWYNYLEAPLFYCGLINLILIPQIFQFLNKRKKIIYSLLIILFVLPVIFPFFRYAFWLFTGDYYRIFSFFIAFILMLFSIKALSNIDNNYKVNLIVLLITIAIVFILLYYPYPFLNKNNFLNHKLQNTSAVFIIIYSFLIFLLKYKKPKAIIQFLIILVIVVELIYFSNITINKRPVITGRENKQKIGFNDYTKDAVAFINKADKSFFRINKDYSSGTAIHSSMNDAKAQNFKGTLSYNSFNQKYYIRFLQEMKIIDGTNEVQTRWAPGLSNAPLLHGFASIKYAFSKSPKFGFAQFGYDSITYIGDVKIFKNKYYLPLGFTYNRYIDYNDFKKLSVIQKNIALYKAFVIDVKNTSVLNTFQQYQLKDTTVNYSWNEFANDIANCRKDTLLICKHEQNTIKGNIKLNEKKMLFFSIPFDKGWTATVDGNKAELVLINVGFTGLLLDKGTHNIELNFTPQYYHLSAVISLIAIVIYLFLFLIQYLKILKK